MGRQLGFIVDEKLKDLSGKNVSDNYNKSFEH
jgi:hypothetical protein